ncbi:type II toxin-antitoxin system HipA family toxin [Hamadaea tsunoensis]|uniref:type II toxin-antitoxin system HipA family toxin n=1 Tax=Hamadaea tsunoensis TaxID=53368 RepID=UPI0006861709|nr:type II toxin-antitoxin system HipA family toxin [Hamadaea tsunoensis]
MAASDDTLQVILGGVRIGELARVSGRLTFAYDDAYRTAAGATPLSLSMPLSRPEHGDEIVEAFLWGLLPDNERVLEKWARGYQVSARSAFGILRHVGADCAGAAQFVPAEAVNGILLGRGEIDWIDEEEIGRRIKVLRGDPTAWHMSRTGQFSLAGAQAKTALLLENDRWGDPSGAVPTTHIIKPAITGFDDHDLNEHVCLLAAGRLGLLTATSRVREFAGERAIVVERYDRRTGPDGRLERVHQEDLCQALGVPPTAKYQNEGGPSAEDVIRLLRTARDADESIDRFVDALAYNWLVAGTDGHAKNYSLLLTGGEVRLAPLYDLASALPYDDMYLPRLRMAMRVGGEYAITKLSRRHWVRFAAANGLDPEAVLARVAHLAAGMGEAFAAVAADPEIASLGSAMPGRLAERVASHALSCQTALRQTA